VETQSAVLTADAGTVTPGRPGTSRRVLPLSRAHVVWGAGSLLAAAAVLTMMVTVGNRSTLADLAAAVGEERTVEARLTGGFRYGPVRAPVRSGGSSAAASDNWTLYAAAGRIREDAEHDPSAPNLHALGLAHLVLGHYDEAVRAIEDAIAEDPEPPRYHSDLAAAYLARAKHLDRPDDLPRALGAAERALTGNEALLEARFNRALALEALYLEDQARQAWEAYLARDSASGWAADARTHLQALQQRVAPQDGARNNSPPPITDTSVEAALDWLLRQGLPAWADAVLAGDSERAASERSRLTSYAQQITATNGDRFATALAEIAQPDVSARRRAMAVRGLANARAMVEGDDTANLEPTLLAACVEPHSALVPLCHLEVGRLDVIQRRDNNARNRIAMLQGVVGGSAYLDGRLDLLEGYRSMFEGDYAAALERYQRAFQRLSDAKYSTLAGHAAAQIADMFELVGFPSEAWQWRLGALRNSSAARDPNLKYLTHVSAAESLARGGNMSAAAQFVAAVDGSILETVPALRQVFLEVSRRCDRRTLH
jgi:tetratricopeptide (TPR) repeat protein